MKSPDDTIDKYIVVLKRSQVKVTAQDSGISATQATTQMVNTLAEQNGLKVERVYSSALHGGVYEMSGAQAEQMRSQPQVAYIEKDQIIRLSATQSNATWGLDRLDQAALPLNQSYASPDGGASVNAYVIDTGILTTHAEFQGRASSGGDFVDNDQDATDCNGHGTHVAGTIASRTYGVSKSAKLFAVRVLDCSGSGSISGVIAGIDWVTANHVAPAVANMSLGGGVSQAIDDAINASVQAGVTYVVAAGNENTNACNGSPARVPSAITVGSTTKTDARSSFSNFGNCVDVFAPGSDILSTWYTSSTATNTISGTSMASPHVAGVVALYLSKHPGDSPAQVANALVNGSTPGKVTGAGSGSPNRLLNSQYVLNDSGDGDGGDNGGDDDEDPDDGDSSVLQNGVVVAGLAGPRNDEKLFSMQIPAGSSNLVVDLFGGSGDADIYVRFGQPPSTSSYDCRPFDVGNTEKCTFAQSSAGVMYVMVKGFAAYSGASLRASYQAAGVDTGAPCTACTHASDNLSGPGDFDYQPGGTFYQSAAGVHQYWLRGPDNADFELYLYRWDGVANWVAVASSTNSKSTEQINYAGSAGFYLLKVHAYAGSGKYDLWRKVP